MQHLRAHAGQQAHLPVAQRRHAANVFHQPRIGGLQAVHVRPVLIEAGPHRRRHQRAGDVRTAAREGTHVSRAVAPVKPGDDGVFQGLQPARQEVVGKFQVGEALAQANDLRRVDKFPVQIPGQQQRAKVFPAAGGIFRAPRRDLRRRFAQIALYVHAQLRRRSRKASKRRFQRGGVALSGAQQQIRDFFIRLKALSRRRNHHKTPRFLPQNDGGGTPDARRVRQRCAAEFAYDHRIFLPGAAQSRPRAIVWRESPSGASLCNKTDCVLFYFC